MSSSCQKDDTASFSSTVGPQPEKQGSSLDLLFSTTVWRACGLIKKKALHCPASAFLPSPRCEGSLTQPTSRPSSSSGGPRTSSSSGQHPPQQQPYRTGGYGGSSQSRGGGRNAADSGPSSHPMPLASHHHQQQQPAWSPQPAKRARADTSRAAADKLSCEGHTSMVLPPMHSGPAASSLHHHSSWPQAASAGLQHAAHSHAKPPPPPHFHQQHFASPARIVVGEPAAAHTSAHLPFAHPAHAMDDEDEDTIDVPSLSTHNRGNRCSTRRARADLASFAHSFTQFAGLAPPQPSPPPGPPQPGDPAVAAVAGGNGDDWVDEGAAVDGARPPVDVAADTTTLLPAPHKDQSQHTPSASLPQPPQQALAMPLLTAQPSQVTSTSAPSNVVAPIDAQMSSLCVTTHVSPDGNSLALAGALAHPTAATAAAAAETGPEHAQAEVLGSSTSQQQACPPSQQLAHELCMPKPSIKSQPAQQQQQQPPQQSNSGTSAGSLDSLQPGCEAGGNSKVSHHWSPTSPLYAGF